MKRKRNRLKHALNKHLWIWKWLYYKNYNVHIQGGVFFNGNGLLAGEQAMSEESAKKSKCRNRFKEMTLKWFVWQTPDLKILVYNFTDPAFPLSYFLFIFFLSFFKISEACEGCHYFSLSGFVCEVYCSVNLKCYCVSPENPLEILIC